MNNDIDVIIPVFNGERYIAQAIDSVLKQTYLPKNIIVIDDGSNDNTIDVVNNFSCHIKIVKHITNRGLPALRNSGVQVSESDYVAFLDSDDAWLTNKLQNQIEEFKRHPQIGLCYTDLVECDEFLNPKKYGRKFKKIENRLVHKELYLNTFSIPPSTVMVKRDVFSVCGIFDESMLQAEDFEYWLRITSKFPISCINEPLCYRRNNPYSITNTSKFEKSTFYVFHALDLHEKFAKENNIKLELPIAERKKLFLYRSYKECIRWRDKNGIRFYNNKLDDFGGIELKKVICVNLIAFYISIKSKISKIVKLTFSKS